MLMSALRRLEIGCAVFVRSEAEFNTILSHNW